MSLKLSALDKLWIYSDPTFQDLIIRCEIDLAGTLDKSRFNEIIKDNLLSKYDRLNYIFEANGKTRRTEIDFSYHVIDHQEKIYLSSEFPLWRFFLENEGNKTKITLLIHHSLADGVSLVRLLRDICEKKDNGRPPQKTLFSEIISILNGAKFIKTLLSSKKLNTSRPKDKSFVIHREKAYNFRFQDALEDFALRHEKDLPLNSLIMMPIRMDYFFSKTFSNYFGNQIAMVPIKFQMNSLSTELDKHIKSKGYKAVFLLSNLIIYLPKYLRNWIVTQLKTRISALVTLIDISKSPLFLDGKEILEIKAWSPTYKNQILAATYISYCNRISICISK
jgi:hypothetical protein